MPTPLYKLVVLLLAACLLPCAAQAQAPSRPRIGLVLGGGGARGTAHIGVLEVLDQLRVPVDCVAGTSMGALVSGAYASGLTSQEMLVRLGQVDWHDLFDDNPSQMETNYRERRLAETYYPGLEFGVTDRGLRMAHGVVGGQKIKLFFNTLVGSDRGERKIENLALPLSILATDIGTGNKVVFRDGQLSEAMRASMSVPALLSPVPYRGMKLVDGGLVDNLPVDEVRARCNAEVVIAVDVGSPLSRPEDVDSIASVTGQMINVLAQQNSVASLKLVGPRDVYIKPNLEGITAADFTKFREGAARGRAAALAAADKLRQYAVPVQDYAAWTARLRGPLAPLPRVDDVRIAPLAYVNPENVARHIEIRPGQQLDTKVLERDLARIYGDGDFESVDYLMQVAPDRNTLLINPVEKSWGPDYLRFGVSVEAGDKQNDFAVRGAYHRKWINSYGAEWLSGAQLGERSNLFTEFYQPLDPRQRFFVEPGAGVSRDRLRVYQDDQRIAEYILRQKNVFLNAGINLGVYGQARLGWLYRKLDTSIETGPPTLPTGKVTLRGYNALLDLDQTDRVFFPSRGWFASANYFRSPGLGYSRLGVDLRAIHSWDPYVVNARYYYFKRFDGRLPLGDAGGLGGFLTLSGYTRNQILAGDIRFFSVRGERIIGRMPLGLSGDLRAGVSLEFGRARERFTETHLEGWQQAVSFYLGGDTPLGPLYFGYGQAKGGRHSVYLFLGLP
ncbi:patatin-like phospholipase family protein [Massilia solisilvae]|uniref:Patatin-like phospholipase family protein n=1 Tax=Massilia solisilvae TaxID=1811225 RepID=A0ABT2BFZ5_9BURK|nr:patatin-like phospholipase family protein [Massilia solisilvae]MCS0607342.1 patatin-like phospholipase family protein [Massilia solisilvae]